MIANQSAARHCPFAKFFGDGACWGMNIQYAQTLHQKIVIVYKDVELIESDHPYLLETIQELIHEHSLMNPTIENVICLEIWIDNEKVSFFKHCLKTFM
jgi:hypothetical protein